MLWSARAGWDGFTYDRGPSSGDLEPIAHWNLLTNIRSANYNTHEDSETERLQVATDLTWFTEGPAGSHEVKIGIGLDDLLGLSLGTATMTVDASPRCGDLRSSPVELGPVSVERGPLPVEL